MRVLKVPFYSLGFGFSFGSLNIFKFLLKKKKRVVKFWIILTT